MPWTRYLIKNSGSTNHHDQAFGDFDGDGRLELAFWNQHAGGKLYVAEIPADPKATEPWIYVEVFDGADNSEGMAVADIDGDGVDDIVGAGYWFKHVGGSSLSANLIVSGRPYTRTAVGDLIPGGRPEVVIVPGDANGSLDYYEWNGATWDEHEIHSYVIHGHSIGVGDVNLDGHLDVFVGEMGNPGDGANCDGWVFYGDGAGDVRPASGFHGRSPITSHGWRILTAMVIWTSSPKPYKLRCPASRRVPQRHAHAA